MRIFSWDADGYFNHNAKLYTSILKPQKKLSSRPALSDTRANVEAIIELIKGRKIDITQSYKEEWLKIASALANEFGDNRRDYFHAVSRYHDKYDANETDRMFDNVLKHGYSKVDIGVFFNIASDYGIRYKGEIATVGGSGNNQYGNVPNKNNSKTLSDIGISRKEITTLPKVEKIKSGPWSNEITELEQFFSSVKLPDTIKLNQCSTITDINLFIKSHLDTVKGQNGNKRFIPYLDRLNELKEILKQNLN